MRRLFLISTALLALGGIAQADVLLDTQLSGTGDNVIFQSLNGNLAVGSFNGQHQGLVDFTCLAGCVGFTGAANGNDIKISNTTDLQVQVFDTTGTIVQPTATDVFSLKGTGDVTAIVIANESGGGTKTFTFDLGVIDPNAQSGFTLTAVNGETIDSFRLVDVGGNIVDFEHYRIDVAGSVTAVPEASTWFMMIVGFLGVGLLGLRNRNKTHSFRFV